MIPTRRAHVSVAAKTHPGMKGKNNEDRYVISTYYVNESERIPSVLAVVSDGIGGHRAGEVAAEIAVETIKQRIGESDADQPPLILHDAIVQASEKIREQAETDPAQKGMGATCVCAWVIGDRLYAASVGDSRLYLIRDHTIRKLSIDHTWVQEAIDRGAISPDQARSHPNAHVIRRYLGSPQIVVPDLRLRLGPQDSNDQAENNQGLPLLPGDVLVLCSDGLTDLVDDPEILETLETKSLESALSQLVDLANQRGGHDNITVIALQIPPIGTAPVRMPTLEETKPLALAAMSSDVTQQIKRSDLSAVQKEPSPSRKIIIITCLSISSLIILAAGVFGAFSWLAILSGQATDTPTRPAEQSSATATELASPRPTQTFTAVSSITASANTPQPPQATLTPWPTNTLTAPSKTPPNPFITSIVTTLTMSH